MICLLSRRLFFKTNIMLEKEFWGNTVENWGIAILIVLGAFLFVKLISLINKKLIKPFTQKTANQVDDIIYESLEPPILFGIMILGMWIAIHHLTVPDKFMKLAGDAYRILVTLNVTWFFASLFNGLLQGQWKSSSEKLAKHRKHYEKMMPMIRRTVLIIVWIIGIVTALSNVGVNISALLGTLGIGGIALALAAQDTVKNVFGAITIFTDRPFNIGDVIQFNGFEGTVVDIGIRSTKMRGSDKRLITFPNSRITDAPIVNITAEPMRRVVMKIGLTYDTSPEKMGEALKLLLEIPSKIEFVAAKDITANFTDFGDSALLITFTYYIEKKGDIGKTTSDVNMEILTSFNQADLKFAFPSTTVYMENSDAFTQTRKES